MSTRALYFARRGTRAPFSRASDRPIAIACFRLLTRFPLPLFRVPDFRRCIADLTAFRAPRPYLGMTLSFSRGRAQLKARSECAPDRWVQARCQRSFPNEANRHSHRAVSLLPCQSVPRTTPRRPMARGRHHRSGRDDVTLRTTVVGDSLISTVGQCQPQNLSSRRRTRVGGYHTPRQGA